MSATMPAGVPLPHLHRSAGRASVPGPGRDAAGRARPAGDRWSPSPDEPRAGGPGGPGGP
ncbi:LytR family transcriptional regulator, partial [Micromonospora sp. CPCC 205561]